MHYLEGVWSCGANALVPRNLLTSKGYWYWISEPSCKFFFSLLLSYPERIIEIERAQILN